MAGAVCAPAILLRKANRMMKYMLINSVKQIIRASIKTALFFCVLIFTTMILLIGVNLWYTVSCTINEVESTFSTLGTVQQAGAKTYPTIQLWNTSEQGTSNRSKGSYVDFFFPSIDPLTELELHSTLPVEILHFDGAAYEMEPVKRPYFGATSPNISDTSPTIPLPVQYSVIEFVPYETSVPSVPTKVQVTRVISGHIFSKDIYLCDHYNESPVSWKSGHKYIAYVTPLMMLPHTNFSESVSEYSIFPFPQYSNTYSSNIYYAEVTDNFYDTSEGKAWLTLGEALDRKNYSFTVVPTDSLELLPSFHSGKTPIDNGREILQEEFESGAKVCILPSSFLTSQGWKIGDCITLQLYYADYRLSPRLEYGRIFNATRMNLLDESGSMFDVFWEADYEIVGSYSLLGVIDEPQDRIELGDSTFIIPENSIETLDTQNISEVGPMLWTNTSFIIPNGTADEFLSLLNENVPESEQLEILFDDGGYSSVANVLRNMKAKAILLLILGLLSTIITLLLMQYFYIIKCRLQIGVQICFGMSKQQCRISVMSGILILVIVSFVVGLVLCLLVFSLNGEYSSDSYTFSTDYSNWEREEVTIFTDNINSNFSLPLSLCTLIAPFLFVTISSLALVNHYSNKDALILIGRNK